jgi:hypothetical protein
MCIEFHISLWRINIEWGRFKIEYWEYWCKSSEASSDWRFCIIRWFIICIDHEILFCWSNQNGWEEWDVWKLLERGETVQEWCGNLRYSLLGKGRHRNEDENKVVSSDYSVIMTELDWPGSSYWHVAGFYVCGNEVLDSREKLEIFNFL